MYYLNVCMYFSLQAHMHIHMYTFLVLISIWLQLTWKTYESTNACMFLGMYTCTYVHVCVSCFVFLTFIHTYIHMYVYTAIIMCV